MHRDGGTARGDTKRIIRFRKVACRRCRDPDPRCASCDGTGYCSQLLTSPEALAVLATLIGDRLSETGGG